MPVTLRPLTSDDRQSWGKLWGAYLEFYGATRPPEIYDLTFARLLDPDRPQHGILAELDGEAVGLVHFIFHAHNWHAADVCYLQDLFAQPHSRGKGVGRALIEAVYDRADAAGAADVYWLTQDFNTTARALYDQVAGVTPFIKYSRAAK
ncbi:MAG: GNAT family N-acetyltransferase [Mangrovicoccus sp.]